MLHEKALSMTWDKVLVIKLVDIFLDIFCLVAAI